MVSARGNARGNAWAQAITGQTPSLGQRDYSQVAVPAHTRMRPVTVSGAHRGGETVLAAKRGLRRVPSALPVMRPTAPPMGAMPGQGAMSNMPPEGPGGQPFPAKRGAKTVKMKAATGASYIGPKGSQTTQGGSLRARQTAPVASQAVRNANAAQRNANAANAQRNANATAAARNKDQQGAAMRTAPAPATSAYQSAQDKYNAWAKGAGMGQASGTNYGNTSYAKPTPMPTAYIGPDGSQTTDGGSLRARQTAPSPTATAQPVGKNIAAKRGEKTVKMSGSFRGKSNKLGHGGRAAQLKAKGGPGGVIGNLARAAGAAPGGPNYHAKKGARVTKVGSVYGRGG